MAAVGQTISVGTTPTLLFEVLSSTEYNKLSSPAANIFPTGTPGDPLPILLVFLSANTIYCGGSGVTTSAGALMTGVVTLSYNAVGGDSLYGVVASSTQSVQLLVLRQ
jgi:hypothetical protein